MKPFRQNIIYIGDGEKLMFQEQPGNKKGDKNNCIEIFYNEDDKNKAIIWLNKYEIEAIIEELEYWKSKL